MPQTNYEKAPTHNSVLDPLRNRLATLAGTLTAALTVGLVEQAQYSEATPIVPQERTYLGLTASKGPFSEVSDIQPAVTKRHTDDANSTSAGYDRKGNKLYAPLSKAVELKTLKLLKDCPVRLSVNEDAASLSAKNGKQKLKITYINGGNREKFSWENSKDYKLCGLTGNRKDRLVLFPKPDKLSKTKGYIVDPNPKGPQQIEYFGAFFKKVKR